MVAEVTARSTSAAVAAETVPRVLPVVGFSTVRVSLEDEGVNSLWMKRPVGTVCLVSGCRVSSLLWKVYAPVIWRPAAPVTVMVDIWTVVCRTPEKENATRGCFEGQP